jgi:hypothetical protein
MQSWIVNTGWMIVLVNVIIFAVGKGKDDDCGSYDATPRNVVNEVEE